MTKEELDIIEHATGRNYNPRRVELLLPERTVRIPRWPFTDERGFMREVRKSDGARTIPFHRHRVASVNTCVLRPPRKLTRSQRRVRAVLQETVGMEVW